MRLAAACALIGLCPGEALAAGEGPNICGKTTGQLLKACRLRPATTTASEPRFV